MRPLVFKLLTLLLTIFLLFSFSLSAFALPIRNWLVIEWDEHPHPDVVSSTSYFIVLKTAYGFFLLPVIVKSSKVSNTATGEKPIPSSRKNEAAE